MTYSLYGSAMKSSKERPRKGGKGTKFQWTRRAVIIALVVWFTVQCGISVSKLLAANVATAESSSSEKLVLYPSLTMCPLRKMVNRSYDHLGQTDVAQVYESGLEPFEKRLVMLVHSFIEREPISIRTLYGDNYDELFAEGTISEMMSSRDYLERCITYNPPARTRTGLDNRIFIALNTTDIEKWYILVHNRDMLYPTLSKSFGSNYMVLSVPSLAAQSLDDTNASAISQYVYEIERTKWSMVSTSKNPCSDKGGQKSIMSCIEAHFEEKHRCWLPWTNSTKVGPTCPYNEVTEFYEDLVDTGMQEVALNMGCLASCEYTEFALRHIATEEELTHIGPNFITVILVITSGSYKVKEQYVVYDRSSFISDIGGYLGLLLGQSILTCYDILLKWIQKKRA